MATRVDIANAEFSDVRHHKVQLAALILLALRTEIVLAGRKSSMCPEEPELKGDPDRAVEIETSTNSMPTRFKLQNSREDRSDMCTSAKLQNPAVLDGNHSILESARLTGKHAAGESQGYRI